MVPMKNNRLAVILTCVAALSLLFSGCAGQSAFKQGEKLTREGKLDEAVVSYAEALQKDPERQPFRQKLIQSRLAAAAQHLVHRGDRHLANGLARDGGARIRKRRRHAPRACPHYGSFRAEK